MSRGFQINGESLLRVKFGSHIAPGTVPYGAVAVSGSLYELGLAAENVTVVPRFYHKDMLVDDFGPNIPPEVMCFISDCTITMQLIHYDKGVLDVCMSESMGGTTRFDVLGNPVATPAGSILAPAGQPIGAGRNLGASGCHFMGLNILSPVLNMPWRFPASYLPTTPLELPLGTTKTLANVVFRAIPYVSPLLFSNTQNNPIGTQEIQSSGVRLWDRTLDTF